MHVMTLHPHVTAVTRDEGILHAIDVKDICRNCLYVEIVGADGTVQQRYVSEFPNKIKVDYRPLCKYSVFALM